MFAGDHLLDLLHCNRGVRGDFNTIDIAVWNAAGNELERAAFQVGRRYGKDTAIRSDECDVCDTWQPVNTYVPRRVERVLRPGVMYP